MIEHLSIFLCHSSDDKPIVRNLYEQLNAIEWVRPWLDEIDILPGHNWSYEIESAVEKAHVILVCLSKNSINKEGYVQREIKRVLDIADEKPMGLIYIVPVRLEECEPPRRLRELQYVDYFDSQRNTLPKSLLDSLAAKAKYIGIDQHNAADYIDLKDDFTFRANQENRKSILQPQIISGLGARLQERITLPNGVELILVPAGYFQMGSAVENPIAYEDEHPLHRVEIPYNFWIARHQITNEQYAEYVLEIGATHPFPEWKKKKRHPVINIEWENVVCFCKWLNAKFKGELPDGLVIRAPSEAEWEKAARGIDGREFPWGNKFEKRRCNTSESGIGDTTVVGSYSPQGDSPFGCTDMAGNVWEWTYSLRRKYPYKINQGRENSTELAHRVLRGSSFVIDKEHARCAFRGDIAYAASYDVWGIRIALGPEF